MSSLQAPPEFQTETLIQTLGIEVLEATKERVVATMPVSAKVHQPFGLLHGGASVALAETVASLGAYFWVKDNGMTAVGLEINANHLRGKHDGIVTATALPLHCGRSTHIWEVKITDESDRLVCISRCTLAIVPNQP